jgi:nickel/cobalt exporter
VILISSALFLGFLHGLGADHLMAIAALSVGPGVDVAAPMRVRRARALGVAVRFAVGHALLLALGAGGIVAFGWALPLVVDRAGEMLGGALLIVMGGAALYGVATGRVYGHTHRHGQEPAAHWHLHIGRRERHPSLTVHSHLPTIVGAAFAVSSLRALTLLAPALSEVEGPALSGAPALPVLLVLIGVFGMGILLSMSLFGVAFARAMSVPLVARLGRTAAVVMAVASMTLGVFWIASA